MSKTHNEKILLRLSSSLNEAMDQTLKEKLPELHENRSEFIRRAVRFTIDHVDMFAASDSATVNEHQPVESVEKINNVREQWDEIYKYTEIVLTDPNASLTEKRLSFLIRLLGKMIFRMND